MYRNSKLNFKNFGNVNFLTILCKKNIINKEVFEMPEPLYLN